MTLDELREQMKKKSRVEVGIPTVCRVLESLGCLEKKPERASEVYQYLSNINFDNFY
jgi:hypothetical protein